MTNTQIDDLAARAMAGLLSGPMTQDGRYQPDEIAKRAYAVADAMAEEKRRRDKAQLDAAG